MSNIIYKSELGNKNDEVEDFLKLHWGSVVIVSRGKAADASILPRIIAFDDGRIVGLATYSVAEKSKSCELVSIDSIVAGKGIGSKIIGIVESNSKKLGVKRIWLVTTNDNMEAVNFYLKNGYLLKRVHLNALDISRKLKPQIPKVGKNGIPLLHELEFEKAI